MTFMDEIRAEFPLTERPEPPADAPAHNEVWVNIKSGKQYLANYTLAASAYTGEGHLFAARFAVSYQSLRNGKRFGPLRSARLEKFTANFRRES
jgi:hypothetical protein